METEAALKSSFVGAIQINLSPPEFETVIQENLESVIKREITGRLTEANEYFCKTHIFEAQGIQSGRLNNFLRNTDKKTYAKIGLLYFNQICGPELSDYSPERFIKYDDEMTLITDVAFAKSLTSQPLRFGVYLNGSVLSYYFEINNSTKRGGKESFALMIDWKKQNLDIEAAKIVLFDISEVYKNILQEYFN
ncbi:Uncharacterised protein [Candidatus Tiddalikarchaeum anstoanum]|nr:Uncharacterised protein [Candidatus Tiddalikarchaeum anstoanum]